tara:strand:+ start:1155 stop:1358 length:204 start_codon:yes stop_codon:yes gene_type:complete
MSKEEKERDIRAEIIADDIINLTDVLDSAQDLDDAWKRISEALYYLSAKDTMCKMVVKRLRKNHQED